MSATGPIFTGGTGRSGTTVLSHLLDHHAEVVRVVPTEVRFITDPGGLIDLLEASRSGAGRGRTGLLGRVLPNRPAAGRGVVTAAAFADRLRGHWYHSVGRDGTIRGLKRGGLDAAAIDGALDGFEERLRRDPLTACRRLASEILAAMAGGAARRWVETTPTNAARPHGLLELFPDMGLIHVVRDGRDTAGSVVTRRWGPTEMFAALDWWAERIRVAYEALESFPSEHFVTIRLEDLVQRRRDETYERVRTTLQLPPDEGMRRFFDDEMSPERGHLGRWRSQLPAGDVERFDRRYREHLQALRDRFGPVPPTEDLDASDALG